MKKIRKKSSTTILDCTLRDGGYYNNWDFESDVVERYLKSMQAASVDVIEIGCGYGGQALILSRVMEINSYTFLDLWQVNLLIRSVRIRSTPSSNFCFVIAACCALSLNI